MKSLIFLVLAIVLTLSGAAHARKPAVEDFVGIESETPDVTPEGTEALFNFQDDVKEFAKKPNQPAQAIVQQKNISSPKTTNGSWPIATWLGVLVVLALPFVTWMLTMRHLKTASTTATPVADLPSNVTPLPVRETKKDDDIKKAS
ncbi:MAG: hypothetical protein K2P81_17070 [Bacteriovoracaceae bacterium]|nr:hypothetical protein [Bacteriovoracaceae bacterium]